jgi:hypothetical protein
MLDEGTRPRFVFECLGVCDATRGTFARIPRRLGSAANSQRYL